MPPSVKLNVKVEDFKVPSSSGKEFQLSKYKGKKLIFYFYPKDNTPGCTMESIEFNKLISQFKKLNVVIFGISRDTVASHCKFTDKYQLEFELLSDEDEKLCKMFDVIKEKNMYGKKVFGIERSTFILDESQKLIAEFRKVKAQGHALEILNFIKLK